jgi:hypothetical protein
MVRVLALFAGWTIRSVCGLVVRDGKTNFFNQPAISLSCDNLQLNQHPLSGLHISWLLDRVDKRASQDLVYDRNAIDLVTQHIGKNMVAGGQEQRLDNLTRRFKLNLLVHNPENG